MNILDKDEVTGRHGLPGSSTIPACLRCAAPTARLNGHQRFCWMCQLIFAIRWTPAIVDPDGVETAPERWHIDEPANG